MYYFSKGYYENKKLGIKIQWKSLYGIKLGQTITDPINRIITIIEYIAYTKYAIEGHLVFVQSCLV